MDTFVKHPAMVCVHESYLHGNVLAVHLLEKPIYHNKYKIESNGFGIDIRYNKQQQEMAEWISLDYKEMISSGVKKYIINSVIQFMQ